ncbi:hypothetical protein LPJ61_000934 [Coemansia biformis]|uniref:RNA polymerase II-associated protein 1 N-terminal domain-containing protein n=1 Tax=Coemansia biformis TaxID=1286918 RepID=A0A9W7YHW7_9FUNG|nr:hypothetical protein LPJ61_000934 [Coemansia biformis]
MDDAADILGRQGLRRPALGADANEDLEEMQREFLRGNGRPAAQVVRRAQPPTVAGSGQEATGSARQQETTRVAGTASDTSVGAAANGASSSDILDFAQRMSDAIKEFEIKERNADAVLATAAAAPATKAVPKKMSLFAQRRLAKQGQTGGDNSSSSDWGRATGGSGTEGPSAAATFLPKLMAPIPERQAAGPAVPPQPMPRVTGFPEIPTDFPAPRQGRTGASGGDASGAARRADAPDGEYWAKVHEQISHENTDRIRDMTNAEIQEAQYEIRSVLSGDAIQRLLSRKQATHGSPLHAPARREDNDSKQPPKQVRFASSVSSAEDDGQGDGDDLLQPPPPPPPPPPAEWVDATDGTAAAAGAACFDVDDNSTGNDSGFYASMRRKQFPSEVVEDAQLAWMLGHQQAKSPMEQAVAESRARDSRSAATAVAAASEDDPIQSPASRIRFAFDGQILEEEATVPTNVGLHHHGEDPDRPGYTIPELLHLSRSAFPAQRTVAMTTLGAIVHKINSGAWDLAQSAEVYAGLLDWQAELYFAHGISDANRTSRAGSVVALWSWVVETAKYKTLVRLATGGQVEEASSPLPGPEVNLLPEPVIAKGVLVERTFKAMDSILDSRFMDTIFDTVSHSLVPDQQLTMLAECVKVLTEMAQDFDERIRGHHRLLALLQDRFPFIMSKT